MLHPKSSMDYEAIVPLKQRQTIFRFLNLGFQKTIASLCLLALVSFTLLLHSPQLEQYQDATETSVFARFPRRDRLEERYQRITLVAMWDNDNYREYLRHFIYSMKLNADVADLIFINRKVKAEDSCIDFDHYGVDVQSSNIKVVCMEPNEWIERHVNFLCNDEEGWGCNDVQNELVRREMEYRDDRVNVNWKPFHGQIYRDLFINPERPLWGWIDLDSFVGQLNLYPLHLLSKLSFISSMHGASYALFMPGQLTMFNGEDKDLRSIWRLDPALQSPEIFASEFRYRANEEMYWSRHFMRSDRDDAAGRKLSWAAIPDMQGDDYYERDGQRYLVSGRDVMLVDAHLPREALEELLRSERETWTNKDYSTFDWTDGIDGSEILMKNPDMDPNEALNISRQHFPTARIFRGSLDVQKMRIGDDCPNIKFMKPEFRQCVPEHPQAELRWDWPSLYRTSILRLREQAPGYVFRRMEPNNQPMTHSHKIIRHHLGLKRRAWFEFPPFEITPDKIMLYNSSGAEVFQIGERRDVNLFELWRG